MISRNIFPDKHKNGVATVQQELSNSSWNLFLIQKKTFSFFRLENISDGEN